MKTKMLAVAFCLVFISFSSIRAKDIGDFKFLYQVKNNEAKVMKASVQSEQGKFLLWEKGKIIAKDVANANGWNKYLDFSPEDLGIRMEEENAVKILVPGDINGLTYDTKNKKLAFLMHLGDSVNSLLAIEDVSKNKVVYSNSAKIHPMVPGRRIEFMAIETLNLPACFSDDGKYVAYGAYTYLYVDNVEILDLENRTKTVIHNASSPVFWKDKLFYQVRDEKKKTTSLYSTSFPKLKNELFIVLNDKTVNTTFYKGIYYAMTDTGIWACALGGEKKFIQVADIKAADLLTEKATVGKFFIATSGNKDYIYVLLRVMFENKIEYKMYAKEII